MKIITLSLLALGFAMTAAPSFAADLMVASAMQRCSANEECQLVTNSCADNCAFVPVNKANMPVLEQLYQTRCNKAMTQSTACSMTPPIAAACINNRCTIDYPYANNAGPKDYQSGAYATPEAPVADKVTGDYSQVNDRKGNFTAYNLPATEVKQDTVGQIVTKIYVPASAPVSGGMYVPVGGDVAAAPAAIAPAAAPTPPAMTAPSPIAPYVPAAPEAYVTPGTPSTPVPPAIPETVVIPAPAPVAAPAPAAVPATNSGEYVAPPVMSPSKPNQMPPAPAPVVIAPPSTPVRSGEMYVPSATPPTYPAPGLEPAPRAPDAGAPILDQTGMQTRPQAPAGAIPVPPSDLKPAPTFVPPAGSAVPATPDTPGALPPEGSLLTPPSTVGLTVSTNKDIPTDELTQTKVKSFSGASKQAGFN